MAINFAVSLSNSSVYFLHIIFILFVDYIWIIIFSVCLESEWYRLDRIGMISNWKAFGKVIFLCLTRIQNFLRCLYKMWTKMGTNKEEIPHKPLNSEPLLTKASVTRMWAPFFDRYINMWGKQSYIFLGSSCLFSSCWQNDFRVPWHVLISFIHCCTTNVIFGLTVKSRPDKMYDCFKISLIINLL